MINYTLIISWIKFKLFVITSKIIISNKLCTPPYMIMIRFGAALQQVNCANVWTCNQRLTMSLTCGRCPLLRSRPPGSPHAPCPALPSVSIRHFRWMSPPCFRHSPSTKTGAFIGKFDVFMSGHNRTSDGDIRSRDDELIDFNRDSNDNNEDSV